MPANPAIVPSRAIARIALVDPGRRSLRRISVIGPSGSGKTFLARVLAQRLGLPHHELDAARWDSAGGERPVAEFVGLVEALAERDAWIIDGHYRDVRHLIWRQADMVVWLNYSLPVVALRLLGRFAKKRRPARVARGVQATTASRLSAPGSVSWSRRLGRLARTLRERREYRRLLGAPEYVGLTVTELRSSRDASRWLQGLGGSDGEPSAPAPPQEG